MRKSTKFVAAFGSFGLAIFPGSCIMKNSVPEKVNGVSEIRVSDDFMVRNKELLEKYIDWNSRVFINTMKDISDDTIANIRSDGDIEKTIKRYSHQHRMCLEHAAFSVQGKEYPLEEVVRKQYDNVIAAATISRNFIDYEGVRDLGEKAYYRWSSAWSNFYRKALKYDKPVDCYQDLFLKSVGREDFDALISELRNSIDEFFDAVEKGTPKWNLAVRAQIRKIREADLGIYSKIREHILNGCSD